MPQSVDARPVFQYVTKTIYIVIYSYLSQVAADSLHASSFLMHTLIKKKLNSCNGFKDSSSIAAHYSPVPYTIKI